MSVFSLVYRCPDCGGTTKAGRINDVRVCNVCNGVFKPSKCVKKVMNCPVCKRAKIIEEEKVCEKCRKRVL